MYSISIAGSTENRMFYFKLHGLKEIKEPIPETACVTIIDILGHYQGRRGKWFGKLCNLSLLSWLPTIPMMLSEHRLKSMRKFLLLWGL